MELILAKGAIDHDPKDNYHHTPLSLAESRAPCDTVNVLVEKYKGNGMFIRDKDINITTYPTADYRSHITCDKCGLRIPDFDIHYHCKICIKGDFDVCQRCISNGMFCFDYAHQLSRRTVKNGTLVEVSEQP